MSSREGDAHTTDVPPGLIVGAGDVVGTSVRGGVSGNFFFDRGVDGLRHHNITGRSHSFQAIHSGECAAWAKCWFDNLSPVEAGTVVAWRQATADPDR